MWFALSLHVCISSWLTCEALYQWGVSTGDFGFDYHWGISIKDHLQFWKFLKFLHH